MINLTFRTSIKCKSSKFFKNYFSSSSYLFSNQINLRDEIENNHTNLNINKNSESETKLLKVALIGLPNAGKSSIINQITGRMICPISSKVHTTQKGAKAVFFEENTQIVFLDTPGLVGAKESQRHNLETTYMVDGEKSLLTADLVGVVHDSFNHWTRDKLDQKILRFLYLYPDKNFILILNKVDKLKSKRKLLDLVRILTCDSLRNSRRVVITPQLSEKKVIKIIENQKGWPAFSEVFMVSAQDGTGIPELREYLKMNAKPSPLLYKDINVFTDRTPESLIIDTVRSTFLEHLPQEIPYNLKTKMEYFHVSEEGTKVASVKIHCPSLRLQQLVVGSKGSRIRTIAKTAEQNLSNAFRTPVILRIEVVSPNN